MQGAINGWNGPIPSRAAVWSSGVILAVMLLQLIGTRLLPTVHVPARSIAGSPAAVAAKDMPDSRKAGANRSARMACH